MSQKPDFLELMDRRFTSADNLVHYLDTEADLSSLSGEFNIFAAVNNLKDKQEFLEAVKLSDHFVISEESDDLKLLRASYEGKSVYTYVYLQDDFPVFFTTANKTDELPPTIWAFLQETQDVGRLQLPKRAIDNLRKRLVSEYDDLIIPYFSARRSYDSNTPARRRPDVERSIQYRGIDGIETYKEMRYNYGILPKIMVFERPHRFKFRVKQNGVFVHVKGSIFDLWGALKREMERTLSIKESANTGGFGDVQSTFFENREMHISSPWEIKVNGGIQKAGLEGFESHLSEDFYEFNVSEFQTASDADSFQAEIIDDSSHELLTLKSKNDKIRIFPREQTDIDQSVRIFNFVSDHFDSECEAREVV
ncbi:hypothetical protein [Haloprofundus halophilus]|uniref:hypothetical protein n=1 Tax=Haloprofundus halophilus TaxID=2283527 RepID=UPI000E443B3E|nr:hypothetical protein [Haloprofundus halophilus]